MEIKQNKVRHNGLKILGIVGLVLIVLVGTSVADSLLEADFTASPLESRAPSLVQFKDSSKTTCKPIYYYWQFGDGVTSSFKNPRHLYTNGGFYTVTLTIMANCNGTNYNTSTTKYDYIAVYGF